MTVPEAEPNLPAAEPDTEPTQSALPVASKKKKTNWKTQRDIPFHATITLLTPVRILPEQPGQAQIMLAGEPHTVEVVGYARDQLQDVSADQMMVARLWFRTSEGYVEQLQLTHLRPVKEGEGSTEQPTFSVGGRIQSINTEEGYLVISVEPNKDGLLQNPFVVEVWATLEQLEKGYIKVGRTILASGQYRPGSARLVAKRIIGIRIGERPPKTVSDQAENVANDLVAEPESEIQTE